MRIFLVEAHEVGKKRKEGKEDKTIGILRMI
jgi:hypothetical protein